MATMQARLAALISAVGADVGAIQDDLAVNHQWVEITQAAYTALGTKDPDVLYVIIG